MTDGAVLNGRADESQFAQNPLPIAHAMGHALGLLHTSEPPVDLTARTPIEVEAALDAIEKLGDGEAPPAPFSRVRPAALVALLQDPPANRPVVVTHGAPIVSAAVLTDSVASFDPMGTDGLDPPERDLAIAFRSITETFTSEVSATFLEGYLEGGGALPHGPTLDWYAAVAAFR